MRGGWPGTGVCPANGEGPVWGHTPSLAHPRFWVPGAPGNTAGPCPAFLLQLPGPPAPRPGLSRVSTGPAAREECQVSPRAPVGGVSWCPISAPAIWAGPVFVEPGSRTVTMGGNNSSRNPSELDPTLLSAGHFHARDLTRLPQTPRQAGPARLVAPAWSHIPVTGLLRSGP